MFKNIVKGLSLNVKLLKGMKYDNDKLFITHDEINKEGYVHRHNTKVLACNGTAIAGVVVVRVGINSVVPCIYTDELFKQMSLETQKFIIQHELGHFKYHKDILLGNVQPERCDAMEFEADEYAMEQTGVEIAVKALIELKGILKLVGFGMNKKAVREIDRRIKHLLDKAIMTN